MDNEKIKVLVVDDEAEIRKIIRLLLQSKGYQVIEAANGVAALNLVKSEDVDLIIMDIMMPHMSGVEATSAIREISMVPILFLTAKSLDRDKEVAYRSGGDDYLVKPFGMMEMVSRVKAVLRRVTPREVECLLCLGRLELDPKRHMVKVDSKRVELTRKEYDMLRLFMESPERVFSREQLLSSVWGIDFAGETRTVDVHIGTLRDKLGACGNCIETVRGVGYRMVKSL